MTPELENTVKLQSLKDFVFKRDLKGFEYKHLR
jgi:hypothetical protein